MRVLVTRPPDDAQETAAKLMALGHTPVVAPLLEIRFRQGPLIPLAGVQAILATSSNGLRALAKRTKSRDTPVFAVGPRTAETARAEGFFDVKDAEGDGHALVEAAARWASPRDGALLHAAGADTQGYVTADLERRGFEITRITLYDAVTVEALPEPARIAIENGALDATLFYSPRSARVFAECIRQAGLASHCARLAAYCISDATARALAPIGFRTVCVALRPDGDSVLALLAGLPGGGA